MQTYTREEQCRLWLQSAPSLSWRTREALLTYFGCAESIFEQMGPTVQMMAGDKAYAELQQMKTVGLDALIDRLHRCGAEIIFCGRAGYPALLGEINDPPHALCDGAQSLTPEQFAETAAGCLRIREAIQP